LPKSPKGAIEGEFGMRKLLMLVGLVIGPIVGPMVGMVFGAVAASANTYTVQFTGSVSAVEDFSHITSFSGGQTISGTLTLLTPFTAPTKQSSDATSASTEFDTNVFYSVAGYTDTGSATLTSAHVDAASSISSFGIQAGATPIIKPGSSTPFSSSSIQLNFAALGKNPPLTSLSDLPPDLASMASLLGGALLGSSGTFNVADPSSAATATVHFGVTSLNISGPGIVAATPIPATLPLLVSALGGLGFVGWRRKQANAA
jgi:hypothetical protein